MYSNFHMTEEKNKETKTFVGGLVLELSSSTSYS